MIVRPKFERRFLSAVIASIVVLLSFASVAQATERISVLNGFDGAVNAISKPDSSGTRYFGGDFTVFRPWDTGGGALVGASTGDVNSTFPKVTGYIWAAASDGSGGFYIGGRFSCIGPNISGGCDGVDDFPRNNAAHINADGSVDPSWNPNPNQDVEAIAVSGSTVYLAGFFNTVTIGGITTPRNAAAAVTTAGALTAWNPNPNSSVRALAVSGSNVYLGGWFTNVGGQPRNRAAAVNNTNGAATSWNPNVSFVVNALAVLESTVYLGGAFTTVGGQARNYAAAVTTDGAGTLTPWNPNLNSGVNAIAVLGSTVYLGGWFTTVQGADRNYAAAVNNTNGAATSWNPNPNSGVFAIGVSGSNVYLGGRFTTVTVAGITTLRNRAAALDTDGTLTPWNPNLSGGGDVHAIGVLGSTVYLGGWFNTAGGTTRNRAAALDTDGALTGWNPNLDNRVSAIGVLGSTVYLGGDFTTAGADATPRSRAAAVTTSGAGTLTSWNPNLNNGVNAIAVLESTVYLGGWFDNVGGQTRRRAAAVDATTGIATDWNPNLDNGVYAIAVLGSTVYLGGAFDTAGATPRSRAAAVTTSGTGTLTDWNPNLNNDVLALAVSGSNVYLGGWFNTVGAGDEVATRNSAAAVDTDGALTSWNPNLNNAVRAIGVLGSTVYLGGDFTCIGPNTSGLCDGGGDVRRNRAAAVTTSGTGTLDLNWNPDLNDNVLAIGAFGSTVYLGGNFTTAGGTPRSRVVEEFAVPPVLFDLTVSKTGTGGGTVTSSPAGINCGSDCSESLEDGTSVTLTATPAAGSSFAGWSGSGCSGTSTCTMIMSAARTVNAEFAVVPPGLFNLMVSKSGSGAGTVTSSPAGIDCGADCSETLVDGTSVTLTASPTAGSSFAGWSGAGCSGTSTCTVTMNAARAVDAKFTKLPSNLFAVRSVKAGVNALTSSVVLPGPGTLTQRVTRGRLTAAVLTVCKTSRKVTKAGRVKLTCKLSAATRAALRQRSLRVRVKTTFTPTGGLPASKTQAVTLKSQRPPPYTG